MKRAARRSLLLAAICLALLVAGTAPTRTAARIRPHPRIWLDADTLSRVRRQAAEGRPEWREFQARLDQYLPACQMPREPASLLPPSYALAYQVTGQRTYGECALKLAREQMCSLSPGGPAGCTPRCPYQSFNDYRNLAWIPAVVFDWTYPLLTRADKELFVTTLTTAARYQIAHPYVLTMGSGPGGNLMAGQISRTGLLGLALYGDEKSDEAATQSNFLLRAAGEWFHTQVRPWIVEGTGRGGAMPEGPEYAPQVHQYYTEWFDAVRSATGVDLYAQLGTYARDTVLFTLHSTSPAPSSEPCNGSGTTYEALPWGDLQRGSQRLISEQHRLYMLRLATRLRGTPEGDYATAWLRRVQPRFRCGKDLTYLLLWNLLYPTEGEGVDYTSHLAPDYYAAGMGRVMARSGWDRNASWLGFFAGPQVQGHVHADANSFVFYRKGRWLTLDELGWGLEYAVTELHNTLLVEGKGSVAFQAAGEASIRRYETNPEAGYAYAAGEAANVYASTRIRGYRTPLQSFTRELVYLKPDEIVIFDRLRYDAPARATFLLQCLAEPVRQGNRVKVPLQGQELQLTSLLPERAEIRFRDQKSIDMVAGANYRMKAAGLFRHWRAEISRPAAAAQEQMLHVLRGVDTGAPDVPVTRLGDGSRLSGARMGESGRDRLVIFSPGGELQPPVAYSVPAAAPKTWHLVVNLPPRMKLKLVTRRGPGGELRVSLLRQSPAGYALQVSTQGTVVFEESAPERTGAQAGTQR